MKLKVGKRYVRRDGKITEPLKTDPEESSWLCAGMFSYDPDDEEKGHLVLPGFEEHPCDLIREYVEEGIEGWDYPSDNPQPQSEE